MSRRHCPVRKLWRFGAAAAAGLVCLAAAWAGSWSAPAQDTAGDLQLYVVDEATKRPTPARVEVLDKDGKPFIARDALLIGGD